MASDYEPQSDRDVSDPCSPPTPVNATTNKPTSPQDIAEASKKRANALYQNGLTFLQYGQLRDAFGEFKEATRLDPNNMEIWQKYEETYRAIEPELNAEHARRESAPRHTSAQAASSSQPLGPLTREPLKQGSGDRSTKSGSGGNEIPPTFTFTSPTGNRGLQDVNLTADPDEHAEGAELIADRMFRGHLARDNPRLRGDDDVDYPIIVPSSERRPQAKTLLSEVKRQKVFVTNLVIWLSVMSAVMYYYQVDRKQQYGQPISYVGIVFFSLLIVAFAVGCWKCVTAERPIFVSLSDASKIVCGVIIGVCVIWHYSRKPKDFRPNAPHTAFKLSS